MIITWKQLTESLNRKTMNNDDLRQRALDLLKGNYELSEAIASSDLPDLLQELRIYQVELQLQNDELRKTQSELESAKQKYFDYYEFAPVGYLTLNNKGTILEANLTARDMLREDKRRLTNKPLSYYIDKDYREVFYEHLQAVLREEKPSAVRLRLRTDDGRQTYVTMDVKLFRLANGESGILVILADITALHEAEEVARRAALEQARMGLLTHFIRSASHEFRTPLAILQSSLELTHRKRDFAFFEERYSRLLEQVDKMERILELMLLSSRLYLQPSLRRAPLHVKTQCAGVLDELRDMAHTHHKQVEVTIPLDLYVYADEELFFKAVYELLHNALRHSGDQSPQVRLIAGAAKDGVQLRVEDDGVGVPLQVAERLFQAFERGDNAHRTEGVGLGLSLIKQIMELHGGKVWLDNSVACTAFVLFFPSSTG